MQGVRLSRFVQVVLAFAALHFLPLAHAQQALPQAQIPRQLQGNSDLSPAVREQLNRYIPPNATERWRNATLPQRFVRATFGPHRCLPATREVTIEGAGFGAARAGRDVVVLRRKKLGVLEIVSWSDTRIVGRLPASIPDRDRYDFIMAPGSKGRSTSFGARPRPVGQPEDPIGALNPVSNLVSAIGCIVYTAVTPGATPGRLDPLLTYFPRDNCRNVDLDTLDQTYETIILPRSGPDDRRSDRERTRVPFRITDRDGTVVSFQGPSYDMVAGVFFFILENWLTRVCYGPRMGNYDNHPSFRMMYWTDNMGRMPLRSAFSGRDDSACPGCLDTGTAFKQCRVIPNLDGKEFVEVPPGSRDTRTPREARPVSPVSVWGIRTPFTVGPREFYAVEPFPLFLSEADAAWGKRTFSGRDTKVCSFGAFNVHYGYGGTIGAGADEHDGMQFFVRER